MAKNKQKGITLIALIITIIVMLILVAVTINMAVNGGIFTKAKDAAMETEKQAILEQIIGLAEWDNNGKINVNKTVAKIKQEFGENNVTTNPETITADTREVIVTIKWKNGTYSYKLTTRGVTSLGKTDDLGNGNGTTSASYSNEAVWETDGNGTIIEYLGTEQQIEIERLEDEIENGNNVEVAKIFGEKQQLVEEWVKYLEIVSKLDVYCPNVYEMYAKGEEYDGPFKDYNKSILAYISGEAERPSDLPPDLNTELESFEFAFNFGNNSKYEEISKMKEEAPAEITIPSEYKGEKITTIGNGTSNITWVAFENVIISEGIVKVADNAFLYNYSKCFTLPKELNYIGNNAFSNGEAEIKGLEKITGYLAENALAVKKLPSNLYIDCEVAGRICGGGNLVTGIENIVLGPNVTILGEGALSNCSVKTIEFDGTPRLRIIEDFALRCPNLESFTIPSSVEEVGYCIFTNITYLGNPPTVHVPYKEGEIPNTWDEDWDYLGATHDDGSREMAIVVYAE